MATRGQVLTDAFARIGIAGYAFDLTPEEQASARRKLDAMMSRWDGEGVNLGHTAGDVDDDTSDMTTPDYAESAIIDNLAIELAPDFGKEPATKLSKSAKQGYNLCVAKTLVIPTATRTGTPIYGGGDRSYRGR